MRILVVNENIQQQSHLTHCLMDDGHCVNRSTNILHSYATFIQAQATENPYDIVVISQTLTPFVYQDGEMQTLDTDLWPRENAGLYVLKSMLNASRHLTQPQFILMRNPHDTSDLADGYGLLDDVATHRLTFASDGPAGVHMQIRRLSPNDPA